VERHAGAGAIVSGAIAALLVALQADAAGLSRRVGARRAARTLEILRGLALVREPLGDRAVEVLLGAEVDVVAHRLGGELPVERVVEVVRPHRVETEPARARG